MRRIQIWLAGAVAIVALAQSPTPAAAQATCTVSGEPVMPKDLEIYDAAQGGSAIARFSGGTSPLTVTEFPAGRSGRAKIETGKGSGGFRISGYTDVTKIPIFTARQVTVEPGHVWIGTHRPVRVVGAKGSRLVVEKTVVSPINQTFKATASCDHFTFDKKAPPGHTPSGNARGYVVKKDAIELFDSGSASAQGVTVLYRAQSSSGILFWSEERRGGWVHVTHHGEVVVDAWARARDLEALPPGETMDQLAPITTHRSAPKLALADKPRVVTTSKEVPLQNAAGDKGKRIGKIEPNTETYVLDTVAGWANVLPKSLHVMPVGDGSFWVKSSDLGL